MLADRPAIDLPATQAMRRANVWRVATVLIEQFGGEAGRIAGACARVLDEMGDAELATLWMRVSLSIAELERTSPSADDALN